MNNKETLGIGNSGNRNSGNRNSGDWNSGSSNSGDWNSGSWNSGNLNSGSWNSGDWNSGDWNSGSLNSGYFNTDTPKVRIFNVQTEISYKDFNDKYDLFADIPLNHWVDKENMSDEEKKKVIGWETMGGYLKTLNFKEACQIWWDENPSEHKRFLELPHFNADIFEEITGIKVGEPSLKGKKIEVKIEGKTYTAVIE